ncbi:hypothetical protein NDU88_002726 [Pleurodeles waltl]|uniref:Secreted protein n=1 Tax=Pleurodeles waltl TaxID=8319 RepID=A0AAV7W062_PLEWA|nr:hypothetical protein NDU88_002726 [Pleurodeles waltl]
MLRCLPVHWAVVVMMLYGMCIFDTVCYERSVLVQIARRVHYPRRSQGSAGKAVVRCLLSGRSWGGYKTAPKVQTSENEAPSLSCLRRTCREEKKLQLQETYCVVTEFVQITCLFITSDPRF